MIEGKGEEKKEITLLLPLRPPTAPASLARAARQIFRNDLRPTTYGPPTLSMTARSPAVRGQARAPTADETSARGRRHRALGRARDRQARGAGSRFGRRRVNRSTLPQILVALD